MSLSNRDPYIYSPLPSPTSIRLVRRRGRNDDGLISISLEIVDLETAPIASPYDYQGRIFAGRPDFHCLSYTWNNPHANGNGFEEAYHARDVDYSPENMFNILCDGRVMKIGKNLHDFFQQAPDDFFRSIRHRPHPETGKVRLHDDAIRSCAIVHMYVGQGDPVNAQDLLGRTPMHYAAANGNLENVKIFLKGGTEIEIKDRDDQTAEDLAAAGGHFDVVETLRTAREIGVQEVIKDVPPFVHESIDTYLWIDRVSIDQDNVEERASQVRIMDRIYSTSSYVVAWLGEEDADTDIGIHTLSKLSHSAKEYAESDLVPFRVNSPEEYAKFTVPYISMEEWNALAALFLRQWFRRIWVIQEAVFATGIVMYCGNKRVQWDDLRRVAAALEFRSRSLGHNPSTIYIPHDEIASSIEFYFSSINEMREVSRELIDDPQSKSTALFRLQSLLFRLIPFRCADARDKVYALRPLSLLNPTCTVTIEPNYRISTVQCYSEFMKHLIVDMGNLDALTFVHDAARKKVPGLPSWVLDFSLSGISLLPMGSFSIFKGLFSKPTSNTHFGWNELGICGTEFDEISSMASPRHVSRISNKFQLDTSWFDLLEVLSDTDLGRIREETLGEILWRTLCADTDPKTKTVAPESFGPMFKRFLCALICAMPEMNAREQERRKEQAVPRQDPYPAVRNLESKHFDCVRDVLSKLANLTSRGTEPFIPTEHDIAEYFASGAAPISDPEGLLMIPPDIEPFARAFSRVYGGRRLFVTRKGHLAISAASARVGDVVWLVPGLRVPIILRPALQTSGTSSDENRFHFVGAAYVHGIMRGEAAERISTMKLDDALLV